MKQQSENLPPTSRKSTTPDKPQRGDPNAIEVADALNVYLDERTRPDAEKPIANPKALITMVLNLGNFFGEWIIGELTGPLQRA